ncbi:hypothetical protein QIT80_gp15 (endogenous virus) [Pseudomonas phage phiAH14a]|uniref:Uncharacterized protein n=1 Tax=Pseudomonas phage phiAH14a TaxID=1805958 RepID=A0A1B0VMB1_9CAUD|nr:MULTISPECIES: hypothetical protein [unclassified Pseudomonas]YP_010773032.1 hypothetical protein QIT80_gp15 [Pseudomonas phage phiAH14a]AMW64475.1 hypothetical protein AH14a_p15 [Pseudomonas phage phiAH14a]KAA0946694.1 hypothetical protein FQ182_13290 [Pseudomonas sp. ANT_H4]KAA0953205.1 hypothetical protein FQ186_06575 [Pseudomonas sp. ANT_H14]
MISNHLSMVEALRPASDALAAQVAKYLAHGGQIEEAAPIGYKPKPITYSNQMPPTPKPFVRRKVEAAPLPLARSDVRDQERLKLVERVRSLAANHPKVEVAAELGIDRRTVSKIGKEFGITFRAPTRGGTGNLVPKQVDEAKDTQLAERIRAFMELGITRRQCCGKLAIGYKAFERIIAAHGIDYPKLVRRAARCVA